MVKEDGTERRWTMLDIRYDRYSLIINGHREFIRSGAMHYFRLPSQDLWRDRLFKLKAAGYNTVDLYFCWSYHSPAQGVYDFTGIRDIRKLLQITQELGLYVIARPGPYINAEYSGGGFPGWLLAKKDLPLRNRREGAFEWSEEYMGYVREWWEQIVPILNEAPNIILMQIENEYATLEVEPDYMRALYDMTRELGVKVPLFHNDLYVAGLYEDIVDIYSFDNYSVTQFETDWREMPEVFQVLDHVEDNLRPFCQSRPLMAAELQAGWFGTWKGYKYEKITELLGREHIGISTKSLLGQGLTLYNHYKAIGGTNWDYTGSIETYTSYDFGAPISEAGLNTERLFEAKALNQFLQSFDFTATDRREDFPLSLSHDECLYAIRSPHGHPEACWLFLRNLTYDSRMLTVGDQFPIEVKPFEVIILPYRIPLQCGYELQFSTAEPLYQNRDTLVLKANRPVMLTLYSNESTPLFANESDEIELIDSSQGSVTFQCPELPEDEMRHVRFGRLNVFLLGQRLVDTFWVQENGAMVAGPELRLPDGDYGVEEGTRDIYAIAPDADPVECIELSDWAEVDPPVLSEWKIFDDAPELTDSHQGLSAAFKPAIDGLPDFDANEIYEGSAWYRIPLGHQKPETVEVDARHIWAAFLNGQLLGEGQHLVLIHGMEPPPPATLKLPDDAWQPDGENELLVFVSGLGHPKGFHDDAQTPQGLLSLKLDGQDRTGQMQIAKDVYSRRQSKIELNGRLESFSSSPIVRIRTEFALPAQDMAVNPWGLRLQAMDYERINIYLNGCLIGRYWRDCRCQETFYLPTGILHTEPHAKNTLELILMNFQPYIDKNRLAIQAHQVMLHPYKVFTRLRVP
jgi:hypothetical protein